MSNAQFYYYKNRGQTLGPFDLGQIQQRAKRAQISNRSEISTDGFSWQPAQNFRLEEILWKRNFLLK